MTGRNTDQTSLKTGVQVINWRERKTNEELENEKGWIQLEEKKMTEVDNIIKNTKGKGLNVQNKTFIGKMNKK